MISAPHLKIDTHLPLEVRYAAKGTLRCAINAMGSVDRFENSWLSDRERKVHAGLRDASRRDDWLLGRWMLKQLVFDTQFPTLRADVAISEHLNRLRRIEVLPQTIDGLASRPLLIINGTAVAEHVSLSHTAGGVLVALAKRSGVLIGVDLVDSSRTNDGFLRLWFTDHEREFLRTRPELTMQFWGAKEAAYKALQQGDRFTPTLFEVAAFEGQTCRCHFLTKRTVATINVCQVATGKWALIAHGELNEQPNHFSLNNFMLCGAS